MGSKHVHHIVFLALLTSGGAMASQFTSDPFSCDVPSRKVNYPVAAHMMNQVKAIGGLSAPSSCQLASDFDQGPRSIQKGLLQTMAMIYGNCGVLSIPAMNSESTEDASVRSSVTGRPFGLRRARSSLTDLADDHPYLQWAKRDQATEDSIHRSCPKVNFSVVGDNASCADLSCLAVNYPALYQYGSASPDYNLYKIANNGRTKSNTMGIDCSAFVSEGMGVQGLRFFPEGSKNPLASETRFTTEALRTLGSGKDCFRKPRRGEGLKAGDLLVSSGHVVAVDTIGKDPFGIAEHMQSFTPKLLKTANMKTVRAYAKEVCRDWIYDPADFRITIINSSPAGAVGIQRSKIIPGVESVRGSGPWKLFLLDEARGACERVVIDAAAKKNSVPIGVSLLEVDPSWNSRGITFLRHESDRAECRTPKAQMPYIPGLDCVQCCSLKSDYETLIPESKRAQ